MTPDAHPSTIAVPACRIGILLSGRGSNFAAIQQAIEDGVLTGAEIKLVVSNRPDAPGLALAQEKGIPVFTLQQSQAANHQLRDEAIAAALQSAGVELVILAGYDRILGNPVLHAYPNRILNIHPSLLPAYGGKNMVGSKVHQAVIDNREAESGCTVHLVTDVVDGGAILGQSRVPVLPDDSAATLAERVLAQEHRLYPQVIQAFIQQHLKERGSVIPHVQSI